MKRAVTCLLRDGHCIVGGVLTGEEPLYYAYHSAPPLRYQESFAQVAGEPVRMAHRAGEWKRWRERRRLAERFPGMAFTHGPGAAWPFSDPGVAGAMSRADIERRSQGYSPPPVDHVRRPPPSPAPPPKR